MTCTPAKNGKKKKKRRKRREKRERRGDDYYVAMKAYIFTPRGRKFTILNVFPETTVEQIKLELRQYHGMRPDLYDLFTTSNDELLEINDRLEKLMTSKVDDFVDMTLVFTNKY